MTASVTWPAPPAYEVGRAAPRSSLHATATVGGNVSGSLRFIGARTVEGSAEVRAVVAAPGGDKPVKVTFDIPKTPVPESGDLTVEANGTLPSLTFGKAGGAKLVFGHIDLRLVPKDASGGTPAGRINAPCDLNSGQNGEISTFTIRSAAAGPTGSGASKGAGGSEASGPKSPSDSASGSASASASTKGGAPASTPGDTAAASRPGTPGAPRDSASPAAAETDGTGVAGPLRVVATFLAVSAVVVGCGWWGRRRLRTRGR